MSDTVKGAIIGGLFGVISSVIGILSFDIGPILNEKWNIKNEEEAEARPESSMAPESYDELLEKYEALEKENAVLKNQISQIQDVLQLPDSELVSVPDVVGLAQNDAFSLLTEANLEPSSWWYNGDIDESDTTYYISEQSIPAGSKVPGKTIIKLHIVSPSE